MYQTNFICFFLSFTRCSSLNSEKNNIILLSHNQLTTPNVLLKTKVHYFDGIMSTMDKNGPNEAIMLA